MQTLLELAKEYKYIDEKIARDYASKALDLARLKNERASIVDALILLGPLSSDPVVRIEMFSEACDIALSAGYTKGYIHSLNGLGLSFFYIGKYEKALAYYRKALDLANKEGSNEGRFMVLNNLGILYGAFNNEEMALKYFNEALTVDPHGPDSNNLAITYNNLGSVFIRLKDFGRALQYHKKSLDIKYRINDTKGIAVSLNNIGALYMEMGNTEQARVNFIEAYRYALKNDDKQALVFSSVNLGSLYFNTGKYNDAFEVLKEGERVAESINAQIYLKNIYKLLSDLYKQRGNLNLAFDYVSKYAVVKDSIFSAENQRLVNEMHAKYELEKKEQDIAHLEAYGKSQAKIKGLFIIISVLVLISASTLVSGIRRRNVILRKSVDLQRLEKEKILLEQREQEAENLRLQEEMYANEEINRINRERHEADLNHKSRELSAVALNVLSKNDILIQIKDKIHSAKVGDIQGFGSLKKELLRLIDDNLDIEDDWENFRIHFEEVHPSFFDNIIKRGSDITNNDLRLCAYIRIGMNTKEIARILNISPNSVDQRRYRLRKKFAFDQDEGLNDFIASL